MVRPKHIPRHNQREKQKLKKQFEIVYQVVCKRAQYHCECPFCTRRNIEIHHIKKRSQGGKDNLDNLMVLCHEHHEMAHSQPKLFESFLKGNENNEI